MGKNAYIIIANLFALANSQLWFLKNLDICTSENDLCVPPHECDEILEYLKREYRPRQCSPGLICCSINSLYDPGYHASSVSIPDVTLSEKMCLEYVNEVCADGSDYDHYIVGGTPAKPKEFPFMALIGYGPEKRWACGGTLVSKKFVLSAAHCTYPKPGWTANWVRLGEYILGTNRDDASPEDYRIIEHINHPEYTKSTNYDDIALYRLDRTVRFKKNYIQPICLPLSDTLSKQTKVFSAGWGMTETGRFSNILLKVDLNVYNVNDENCGVYNTDRFTRTLPYGLDNETMICAGDTSQRKDTCNGDSGGPLLLAPTRVGLKCVLHTQVGIVSFGPRTCDDRGLAGVYTKVFPYKDWIESIVWPDRI